ncbi:hypothetical protein [Hymenobacter sublimis]|uniref:Proteinase inhibitor I42 chagasin domain-containing protein n=1 Tax=Hymenobacter sublimis TaxID=2933777 RepID=A0ABY4J6H9_9BACT|nr:hypothetical protein [Hymenobacter sublimis]UPL48240.1 hypothetical protein MWH26_13700 [Hymenobacter sublimis]
MVLFLSGCKKEESSVPAELLFGQTWHNTFQQKEGDFFVFKSEPQMNVGWHYDSFRLEADGQFVEEGPGPADGLESRPGAWTREDAHKYRIRFTDGTRPGYLLEVKLLDKQSLQARRVY